MGKLLIKRLRDDWTAKRGGRTAWREFHDEFLSYGGPPIPLFRLVSFVQCRIAVLNLQIHPER